MFYLFSSVDIENNVDDDLHYHQHLILSKDINGNVSYHHKQRLVISMDYDSSTVNTKVVKKIEIGDQVWDSRGKNLDEMGQLNIEDIQEIFPLEEMTQKFRSSNDNATITLHLPTGYIHIKQTSQHSKDKNIKYD